jgi:uncharacterized protein (TIGR03067 family)
VASAVRSATLFVTGNAVSAAISPQVAALVQGAMKAMLLRKLKTIVSLVLVTVVLGGGVATGMVLSAGPAPTGQVPPQPPDANKEQPPGRPDATAQADGKKDPESLEGTWNIDAMGWGDRSLPKELMKGYKFVFAGNKLTWDAAITMMSKGGKISANDGAFPCDFKIDPSQKPKHIDITLHLKPGDRTLLGIYALKGDELKVYHYGSSNPGKRPTELSTEDNPGVGWIFLTRAKKSDKAEPPPGKKAAAPQSPESADLIKPGDLLNITATGTLPDAPIRGIHVVEASGKVALGPAYGRVPVKGLSLEEAEETIGKELRTILAAPLVSVTRVIPTAESGRPDRELAVERRVQDLEKEVRALRLIVDELRKKPRD